MIVSEIFDAIGCRVLSGKSFMEREVAGVYICDLLSRVMSNAQQGDIWITLQSNINVIVISSLLELSCIIIPENIVIDETIRKKADEKEVIILSSSESSYSIAKKLGEILKN